MAANVYENVMDAMLHLSYEKQCMVEMVVTVAMKAFVENDTMSAFVGSNCSYYFDYANEMVVTAIEIEFDDQTAAASVRYQPYRVRAVVVAIDLGVMSAVVSPLCEENWIASRLRVRSYATIVLSSAN
jgi:hypothetical protein